MRYLPFFIVLIATTGCVKTYQSRSSLPPEKQELANQIESGYIDQAVQSASFQTGCDASEITAKVLKYDKKGYNLASNFIIVKNDRVSLIGVDACGKRITYQVFCGYRQYYDADVSQGDWESCKVFQENSADLQNAQKESDEAMANAAQQQVLQQQLQAQ